MSREHQGRLREQQAQRRTAHQERQREYPEGQAARWPQAPEHGLATTQERIQTIHERFINCPPARGAARAHLIAVASVLFLARGFAAVSMQEIADAVGVTKAALYYHFSSKGELFEAVAERAINDFWEGIIVASRGDGTLREVLRAMIAYVKATVETVSLSMSDDIGRHLSPEAQQRILTGHPTPERELQELFGRAVASGEMRPLDLASVAEMFLAMMMSLAHRGHTQRHPQPGDDAVLLDVLLHGIAAPPPQAR